MTETLPKTGRPDEPPPLVSGVRTLSGRRIARMAERLGDAVDTATLQPGKCLRTRLTARLAAREPTWGSGSALARLCAAMEMVHTASLCHDDVIDGAQVRRAVPALWKRSTTSAAILIGDLLLCDAMDLLTETAGGRYLGCFLQKVRQMVQSESEQELSLRGECVDVSTCLRLARDKTGSLFGFAGLIAAGRDEARAAACEEAGYRVGTAYQLADDLYDLVGSEDLAGKTLGTDRRRGKHTLPQLGPDGPERTREHIGRLCDAALAALEAYPQSQSALARFLVEDLDPVLNRGGRMVTLCREQAV